MGEFMANPTAAGISTDCQQSCMVNQTPGSPNFRVLSFEGAFHGRTLGTLSATRSKWVHKIDIPAFPWPVAPFPQLKYPLAQNEELNKQEEARCLEIYKNILDDPANQGDNCIAAVIIEPVQSEGGDRHASNDYFCSLRNIAAERVVPFIVDEVQTGLYPTGTRWAYEAWGLDNPPDVMVFSKKTLTGGFYYNDKLRAPLDYQLFNTWMGDPLRLLQSTAVVDAIENEGLESRVLSAGQALKDGLEELANSSGGAVNNVRGRGTFLAFDCPSMEARAKLLAGSRNAGVHLGVSGTNTVRFRPALIFGERHAQQALDGIRAGLSA